MLLYDHSLAISDERIYLWKAPPSFAKYAFVINRYLVPLLLLAIIHETCGFNGSLYSDKGCRRFLSSLSMLSTISIATANILILLRVLLLWKGNLQMKIFLYSVCGVSVCTFFSMMLLTIIKISPGIQWNPDVKMCITTTKTTFMTATWAAPLLFDLAALASVVWNTISSPRSAKVPFTGALRKDGITFFLAVIFLQLCNMVFATIARPSLCLTTVFFVWSAVTMILNRSLIRMRKMEVKEHQCPVTPIFGRAMSPFGLPTCEDDEWEMSDLSDHETVLRVRSG